MTGKTYSLRPPTAAKDGLETLFRIEMKKDDLTAEGLKPGDAVAIISQATGKGGVGIAYMSTDGSKSQGNTSFVKMSPRLREYMGLELSEKCSIKKYGGPQRRIKEIAIALDGPNGPRAVAENVESIAHWASVALEQLPCIVSGANFSIVEVNGLQTSKKTILTTGTISSDDPVGDADLVVPFYFQHGTSKVLANTTTEADVKRRLEGGSTTEQATIIPRFTGLPGLEEQLDQLSKCVKRINRQVEERFQHLAGCVPILLHGSSGTGKSSILTQLASNAGWKKAVRLGSADLAASSSKLKAAMANAFTVASADQPSLIVLDDLHSAAGRSEDHASASNLLCEHIHSVKGSKVQIIAATRRPIDIDQKLLSCFKKKIELPTPTPQSRLKILQHFSAGLVYDNVLSYVAEKTHAYTATDLEDLCFAASEAAEGREEANSASLTNGNTSHEDSSNHMQPPNITKDDFQQALQHVHPSLMNELYIEVPKVYWSDIAGSANVKQKLWEAVELPLKHPEVVSRLNLHLNHGILLYGPPGCSKTMTAKALATESGLNFIAVKGPELVSKYVGESEYKIREIFRKARAASPSVIFFDEIDSIAPSREGGGGHEGLNTVATLLNEMDGVEDVQRVLVLAATNRPDAIDPALLRPGRLGTSLYVGPPNLDAVTEILKIRTTPMCNGASLSLDDTALKITQNGCFSGADIGALCDAAGMLCANEAVQKSLPINDIQLDQRHLNEAFAQAKPSLSKQQLDFLQNWSLGRGR